MKPYMTPPREIYNRTIINSMPREGDWICCYCNNLNFAFRKKCNRCKLQTREQNEQYLEMHCYSYTPMPTPTTYQKASNPQPLTELTSTFNNIELPKILTPKKKTS